MNPGRGQVHSRTKAQNGSLRQGMKTYISARADGSKTPSLALLAVCGAIGLLAGCASEPASVVVSAPPPPPPGVVPAGTTVVSNPAPAVAVAQPQQTAVAVPSPVGGSSIVVMQAPPAVQQETPSPRPTSSHVWVPGYWSWRNNQYQWMAGHWEVPPRSGAVWIPPRWQPEGSSWRFYEGYWD